MKVFRDACLGGVSLMVILAMGVYAFWEKMPYGVLVGGVRLGGFRFPVALALLERQAETFLDAELEITAESASVRASARSLGMHVGAARSVGAFRQAGFIFRLASMVGGYEAPLDVSLDGKQFTKRTDELFAPLEVKPRNATLSVDEDGGVRVTSARAGLKVDRAALLAALFERSERLRAEPIAFFKRTIPPGVTEQDLEEPKRRWQRTAANAPYTLGFRGFSWQLPLETLARWVEFKAATLNDGRLNLALDIDRDKAGAFFASLAPSVNKLPQNSVFEFREGAIRTLRAAQNGLVLKTEESVAALQRGLQRGEKDIALAVEEVEPTVTLDKIQALGITALLARGDSSFAGSPANRIHNIKVGAGRYQGLLIPPEGEFSFNGLLGPVDGETGYVPELVIKHNKTVPEYGGGLCQLSTTVFRAAVLAGLPILERQNHSFIVAYYGKPGFDATIYPGSRDFRFRNDTAGYLLLQMRAEGTKLLVDLFGAPDGRTVQLSGPAVYEQKADGSAKALLKRVVTKNGQPKEEATKPDGFGADEGTIVTEDKFYSVYKPKALYPVERSPYE